MQRYRSIVYDSERWHGFEHRPGDIIISTPPKCGTTWMQNIVGMLVMGTTTFERPMAKLSPWLDQCTHDLDGTLADLASRDHRRFVKTHTPLDGLPWHDDVTYVAVGRDPRDVAVSFQHHWDNLDIAKVIEARARTVGLDDLAELDPPPPPTDDPVERYWMFMTRRATTREQASGLELVMIHLRSFWERRHEPNVVLLHYADLEADLPGEMRRLAKRLGVTIDDDRWPELVEAASFESMKRRAIDLAPNAGEYWKDTSAFFHRGGSGRWRALAGDDGGRYDTIVRELEQDEELLSWLHRP